MLKILRPYLSQFVKNTKLFWAFEKKYQFRNPKVLGRHACLGAEVLGRLNGVKSINFQKNRVDHINGFKSGRKLIQGKEIKKVIHSRPIQYCVQRLSRDFTEMQGFDFSVIDSFSELADQSFVFNGDSFYCCYTDITKEIREDAQLKSLGLLPVSDIETEYRILFANIVKQSPESNIIYLHFPMIKEKRERFLSRAESIKSALENLKSEFKNLYVYSLDDNLANMLNTNDKDSFAYHYDSPVYEEFVRLIVKDFPGFKG